jgi:hypothetical protein
METTNFINSLGSADLQSFINVLDAYNSNYETRQLEIEYSGFNTNSGYVYLALENGISIISAFGRGVDFLVSNYRNGNEEIFDTYKDALSYLNRYDESDDESED